VCKDLKFNSYDVFTPIHTRLTSYNTSQIRPLCVYDRIQIGYIPTVTKQITPTIIHHTNQHTSHQPTHITSINTHHTNQHTSHQPTHITPTNTHHPRPYHSDDGDTRAYCGSHKSYCSKEIHSSPGVTDWRLGIAKIIIPRNFKVAVGRDRGNCYPGCPCSGSECVWNYTIFRGRD